MLRRVSNTFRLLDCNNLKELDDKNLIFLDSSNFWANSIDFLRKVTNKLNKIIQTLTSNSQEVKLATVIARKGSEPVPRAFVFCGSCREWIFKLHYADHNKEHNNKP